MHIVGLDELPYNSDDLLKRAQIQATGILIIIIQGYYYLILYSTLFYLSDIVFIFIIS